MVFKRGRIPWNKGLTKEQDGRLYHGKHHHNWRPELHTGEKILCACGCGDSRPKYDSKGRRAYFIIGHATKGRFVKGRGMAEKNRFWKGGRYIHRGYVYIYSPEHPRAIRRRYISEHVLVMEKHLGRYLRTGEVVHHKDGNRQNNEISNLRLVLVNTHKTRYADAYKEGLKMGFARAFILFSLLNKDREI